MNRETVERVAAFCEETARNWDAQTRAVWGSVPTPDDTDRSEYEADLASSQPMKDAAFLLRALLDRAEQAEREREALREALLLCSRSCEHLDHAEHHRHKLGEPCPVEAIIAAALREPVGEAPTAAGLIAWAEWFEDPQRSPHISCPGFAGTASPGAMLRQIAHELDLTLRRRRATTGGRHE